MNKTGLLFEAIPDDRNVRLTLTNAGRPSVIWPGRSVLTPEMGQKLSNWAESYWFPSGHNWRNITRFGWVVNVLGDPDRYSQALEFLEKELRGKSLPVFNPPKAILDTRRDRVWKKLSHIDSLEAPRCERFQATHPSQFGDAFERYGFEYPVLVRPEGSQTGRHLIRISSQKEWNKIFTIPWGGQHMFMTQWVDFSHPGGIWPKLRLSITPEKVRLRHILYGKSWMVHSVERDADTAERELEILLKADHWGALQELGSEIRKALPMDFFGVDIGWRPDGTFVLFEANATMSILSTRGMPRHRRADYMANLKRIETDVWEALEAVAGSGLRLSASSG